MHRDLKSKFLSFINQLKSAKDFQILVDNFWSMSHVLLEVMACGLPVVTTDCRGMKETVINGVERIVMPALLDA